MPVLLLTGTVGAGKTTIALEINDVLAEMQIRTPRRPRRRPHSGHRVEDFAVENAGTPRDVVLEILRRWLDQELPIISAMRRSISSRLTSSMWVLSIHW